MFTYRKFTSVFSVFIIILCMMLFGFQSVSVSALSEAGLKRKIASNNTPSSDAGVSALAATTWYVATTGNDSNSCIATGSPCLTINGAIGKAATSGDIIKVTTGTYTGTGAEVVLINKNITLSGGWNASFTTQNGVSIINGKGTRRGITVDSSVAASIKYFTIQNGNAAGGGGVANSGTLTISYSTIKGNNATTSIGGGIYNIGYLIINYSAITGNTADHAGGISNGNAGYGLPVSAVINNSTISNNADGGIENGPTGTLSLNNVTIYGNTQFESTSAGITNHQGGIVTLQNSIVAGNTDLDIPSLGDCYGSITSNGYNLIGKESLSYCTFTATTGDLVGTKANPIDPRLTPLQDNGGTTFTQALQAESPAIDAGNPATPGSGGNACLAIDQRGITRPQDGNQDGIFTCDMGAYEGSDASGATFTDVPLDHPLYKYIEALYDAGFTAGCSTSPLMFCPDTILDRAQSAVFMLRGQLGSGYTPPPAPWTNFVNESWVGFEWAQGWAEGMYIEGLTTGCQASPLKFCPANQLPRVEASIFGLKMKYGVNYLPPTATGSLFADFPPTDPSYWGIDWAEQAYLDGLLPACGTDSGTGKPMFCPSELVNRAWGAYLIVQAKGLPVP